jgi:Serine dehydrogenase proteinase
VGRKSDRKVGTARTRGIGKPAVRPDPPGGAAMHPALPPVSLSKTPFYSANQSARYQRQAIIRKLQQDTGRVVICYVGGLATSIERDDTLGFVDLLHNVPGQRDLDLVLHTGGGDVDAAEKLIVMVRKRVRGATLRVVVPDYAKSAGTLMVLGADAVVMSDTSELGPIDPQIVLADVNGNRIAHSVQNYLDAYNELTLALKQDPSDVAAKIMLAKIDPATVKRFQAARARARGFAETLLKTGMFNKGGNWSATADELLNTTRWQSHGQLISWQDAKSEKLDLNVEYLEPTSERWQQYWQLYCLQRLAVKEQERLFESEIVSIVY